MLQDLLGLRGEASSNPDPECAWTGDLHGVWQLHRRPAFRWLAEQVQAEVLAYLVDLGFALDRVALHIQRCWPVVSEPGQWIGRHHHPNAHLSAVYYLNGDGSGRSGCLRLFAPCQSNELVPGLAFGHDGPIRAGHPLNTPWFDVAPEAGLLLLFPAAIDHAVSANGEAEEIRVSISFDLVLSAPVAQRGDRQPAEYLAPHPSQWTPIAMPDPGRPSGRMGG